jgi:hypothetical protein
MKTHYYESITFEVEKGLKKPQELYELYGVKQIFQSLFKKRKEATDARTGRKILLNENEPLEILHYELDTNETEFFNLNKKSLIAGLILAYKNHYPITISPDMIWLLILQGYSRFMEKYSELVREKYVNFKGKKVLGVKRLGIFPQTATKEIWKGIIQEFTQKIEDNIGKEVVSNLQADFSTTNSVVLTTSQVSIMSAMKQYFIYKVLMGGCGISSITLEGSVEDWEKIKSRLEFLSDKALKWWTKHLIPIIENIIKTKKYYQEKNEINDELNEFWKGMIRLKGKGDLYDPHMINGWIVKFIPDYSEQKPKLNEEILETEVPDQIISCPMELIVLNLDGTKTEYKCDLASGFYGMVQNKETFNVKPVIGYAIVVDEKIKSELTLEQKNKIIEEFFC